MKNIWGKNTLLMGLMLLFFSWTVFADQQPKQGEQATMEALDEIMNSMVETGAEAERILLHMGTSYRTFEKPEEIKNFAEQLGFTLGLTETRNHQQTQEFRFQRLEEQVLTELMVKMIPSQSRADAWDSYLTVKLSAEPLALDALKQHYLHVYQGLESSQILPHFNTCVQGFYNVTLENDVQLMKLRKLLDLLGAEVVEQVADPTVISISAYTSRLSSYILTNGRPMNVQAGIHVDQLLGLTRITIGTPIITIEY
ncbi:YwmB family TATA-box binding protein [Ammoniphilus sp. YIM 78166]|uniref:YwmB family TATA-box binding protein n=1 Tax=Ammoniphilus sp. YIM 78166 TaxID=1644106 RepID=UPI00106FC79B|nr:YwmB family TATA-box binding protein [Ammoniphilus sp. YIM 78166]